VIKVTCTNRGTHPERVLGWLVDERNPEDGSGEIAFVPWAAHHQFRMSDRDTQRGTLRLLPCSGRRCRRTVRWTQASATRLVDGLIAAGRDQVDVSYWSDRVV
jgi:hypothetical protein